MKSIIQFRITKSEAYYVAEGIDLPVVTQTLTLDKLLNNIQEATELRFENEDPSTFGFKSTPSLLISFELPFIEN